MGSKANYLAAHDDRVIGWTNPYGKCLGNPTSLGPMCSWDYQMDLPPVPGGSPAYCRGRLMTPNIRKNARIFCSGNPGRNYHIYLCYFVLAVWSPLEKWVTFLMTPETASVVQYGSLNIPHPFKASWNSTPKKSPSYHFLWWRAGIESLRIAFRNHLPFMTTKTTRRTLKMERCMKMSHLHVSSIAVSNVVCAWICIYVFVMSQMIKVLQRKEEATMCSAHRFEELWFWDIPKMHHMFRSVIKVIINNQPSRIHNLSRWNKAFTPLDTCCKYIPWRLLGSEPFLSIMIDGSRFSTFWSVSGSVRHSKSQLAHLRPFFFCWEWISLQFQMHYYQYFLAAWATKHGGATWPNKNKVTNI